MTPAQAILAATRVNAELLGWEKKLDTIEVGKEADLLIVEGNPAEDLSALGRVRLREPVGGQISTPIRGSIVCTCCHRSIESEPRRSIRRSFRRIQRSTPIGRT